MLTRASNGLRPRGGTSAYSTSTTGMKNNRNSIEEKTIVSQPRASSGHLRHEAARSVPQVGPAATLLKHEQHPRIASAGDGGSARRPSPAAVALAARPERLSSLGRARRDERRRSEALRTVDQPGRAARSVARPAISWPSVTGCVDVDSQLPPATLAGPRPAHVPNPVGEQPDEEGCAAVGRV